MRFPGFHISSRTFVLVLLAAAWLHYSLLSSRLSELRTLRAQERRLRATSHGTPLEPELENLRRRAQTQLQSLTDSPNATALLSQLALLMRQHGIDAPVIRSGVPRGTHGVQQLTLDIEFESSYQHTVGLLRDLAHANDAWALFALRLDQGKQADPNRLSVGLRIVAFAREPQGGVESRLR